MNIRDLMTSLVTRSRLANVAGKTFGAKRDLYKALGYQRELFSQDYRSRFRRNAVANRIVKALPNGTWRGGAELIEDEDPNSFTEFETVWDKLNNRLKIWSKFRQADILSGIEHYAIVLMGAPGPMHEPLLSMTADELLYLKPYSEAEAKVAKWDIDPTSERFGMPVLYNISRTTMLSPDSTNSNVVAKQVHWTRVLHIADGLLDDNVYGEPRLECVWNDLDNLEKVAGGGAEAFWRRADQGIQFDLDPTVDFDEDADTPGTTTPTNAATNSGMKKQLEEYEHGFRRYLLTRGVTAKSLGSDVSDFKNPVDAIISMISAGTGIPQRVLMGSEQGKLAAKMDRGNWDDRVSDRRLSYADPHIVRVFVDRLIQLGALPAVERYEVRWPELKILDDEQRAAIATQWAGLNTAAGEVVVTAQEIRDRILSLPRLEDVSEPDASIPLPQEPVAASRFLRKWAVLSLEKRAQFRVAASRKERPRWEGIHRAADRFRSKDQTYRSGRLQRRKESAKQVRTQEGTDQ
jgi:hypothetical protein